MYSQQLFVDKPSSCKSQLGCVDIIRYVIVPRPYSGVLSDDARLTSVAYIGPKSTAARPRKTKIGTELAHITCDSDTTFKVKRSDRFGLLFKSPLILTPTVYMPPPRASWLSTSTMHLHGGRGIVWRPHYRLHSLLLAVVCLIGTGSWKIGL